MIFQGIQTRIAKKPYIFVIFFGGGGGLWIRGCPMAANLLASFHFFIVAPIDVGVLRLSLA